MKYNRNTRAVQPSACGCARMQAVRSDVTMQESCGCPANEMPVCQHLPVMAYVEQQEWSCVYDECTAIENGTLFPSLNKPFMGKGGCCRG